MARHTYNIHPTELCIPTSAKGKEPFKFYEKEIITIKKKREKGVRQQQQDKIIQPRCWRIKKEKKNPKRNMSGLVETCFTTADTFFFFNSPRRRRRRTFFLLLYNHTVFLVY
jgi:hypothetical protein